MIDMKKMTQCLEDAGIYIQIPDGEDDFDIDLRDFVESSIQFISIIIAIENVFDIEIPDEYLLIDTFASFKDLMSLIEELQEAKKQYNEQ